MPRKSIQKTKKRKTNRKQTRRQRGGAGFSNISVGSKRTLENTSNNPSNRATRSKYSVSPSNEATRAVPAVENTNTCTEEAKALMDYTNIYTLLDKTLAQKKMILNCFREALQERITQGKQNWLVFLAKYGTASEQERFVSPNWVFSDVDSNDHVKNQDWRLLLQMDMSNIEDIKLLFDKCEGLFHYITFDGALAGKDITSASVDSFVKGLTPDGILAAEYKNSDIKADGTTYETGIFYYPTGVVPKGAWRFSTPIMIFKNLLSFMFFGDDIGIQDDESLDPELFNMLNYIATEIRYNELLPECRATYVDLPGGFISEECRPGVEAIMNGFNKLKTVETNDGENIIDAARKRLLQHIQSSWRVPHTIFNGLTERLTVADVDDSKYIIIAIRKKGSNGDNL